MSVEVIIAEQRYNLDEVVQAIATEWGYMKDPVGYIVDPEGDMVEGIDMWQIVIEGQ